MTRDELVQHLAQVLSGLQVPRSMPSPLSQQSLGTALEPYDAILSDSGFGWKDAQSFEEYLQDKLQITEDWLQVTEKQQVQE